MSGHSKWSTIKRQKGVNDAKRGQLFTKLANAITVAVREGGGGDPAANMRLRLAIDTARSENMPKDNIDRAIERGLGKAGATTLETILYEGFGPAGIAVLASAVTDNRNRTTAALKTVFDKAGGSMGQPGSVAWQFTNVGEIVVSVTNTDAEAISFAAIDAGAQDVVIENDVVFVYTNPEDLQKIRSALADFHFTIESAELIMRPKENIMITDPNDVPKVEHFLEALSDLDDVSAVYTNAEIFSE